MKLANRLLAVVFALALLVVGLLVAAEVLWTIVLGIDGELLLPYPAVADYLAGITWAQRPARLILIGLVLVGLLLLWLEVRRRQPGLLLLASSTDSVEAGVERRTLRRAATHAATEVDGIAAADVGVTARRLKVTATAGIRDTTGLQDRLGAHLQGWVDQLGLTRPPTTAVTVREGRGA